MRGLFAVLLLALPSALSAAAHATNVYFGDLHIHSRYSFDAYLLGTLVSPDESYRFAKGETIQSGFGIEMALEEPLDFYAVTDHALFHSTKTGVVSSSKQTRIWHLVASGC